MTPGGGRAQEASAASLPEEAAKIVAIAAHELKNALGGVGAALARCEQRARAGAAVTPAELQEVRGEVRRLSGLVNGLLDGARLDLGLFELDPQPTDLVPFVHRVAETFESTRGRRVFVEVATDGPMVVRCDAGAVEQVLTNFLENAARHTPSSARIAVRLERRLPPGGCRLAVCDDGPGIPLEAQPRLFEAFFRVANHGAASAGGSRRSPNGAGLGLFVCRGIAQAHRGTVGVISAPGAGATFWLDLPEEQETDPERS